MSNYCTKCGRNLKCFACNGTGRIKNIANSGSMCCGRYQSGNFCSNCRKPIIKLNPFKTCSSCGGSGRIIHVCTGI